MIVFLVLFVTSVYTASIASTPSPLLQACTSGESITLTPEGYSFPLKTFNDVENHCFFKFAVPQGYFAYVELNAFELQKYEEIVIRDTYGTGIQNNVMNPGVSNFSTSLSWPVDFNLDFILMLNGTMAMVEFNITVLPATPDAKIAKSYVTFPGSSSVFLYSNQWKEGESYKFTSKTGNLYVAVGSPPNASEYTDNTWNNVFVYDGGVFKGTLARAAQAPKRQGPVYSRTNQIVLYCSKAVNVEGVVMVTDLSNIDGAMHNIEYVPDVPGPFPIELSSSTESAITLVSSRLHPKKVTIEMVYSINGNGVFSYISGGPIQNHSNAANLTDAQMPKVITGYANTFYLSQGDGLFGFDVRP